MRILGRLSLAVLSLATILAPVPGLAGEPHSWCVSGAALTKGGSTDATTNQVIAAVCSESAACCETGGRWGLACVQKGADWAQRNGKGDVCGRYAWAQGPIARTQQYYPRDFNLFALTGNAGSFQHAEGPVAAAGSIGASGFDLANGRQEQVAVVAKGSLNLINGTLHGEIIYGTTYTKSGVSNLDPSDPQVPIRSPQKSALAINFAAASQKLVEMSNAISLYDSIKITSKTNNNTITFSGSDPELNVFSVAASLFANVTSYVFSVPSGAAVIVNVTGTTPVFKNAGFTWQTSRNKMLWNFPKATTLQIQSVGFPGSILAPIAAATLYWGSITGTVVVKSAIANTELYMARYEAPSCGGCLCFDKTWSCSNDTVVDVAGHAAVLAAEAGFLEIDGGPYTAEKQPRTSPTHRVWYSFQPALHTPKSKPLAVLFNGGPGSATSSLMFAFNTATWTLDPDVAGDRIAANPSAWTKFANLLYIDAPATGFSYPLPYNGVEQDIGMDIDRDAGVFLRVIARFLGRHPALQNNRVVLVAESYGGTRAALMLHYLYNYQSLKDANADYRDGQLSDELASHFAAVFGTSTPSASVMATKFGHQVLIQPGLVGKDQQTRRSWSPSGCAPPSSLPHYPPACYMTAVDPTTNKVIQPTCDPYDCDKPNSAQPNGWYWIFYKRDLAVENLGHISVLNRALGVDASTIRWMNRTERTQAYGREDGSSSRDMLDAFGSPLSPGDTYFVASNDNVLSGYGYPSPSRDWYDAGVAIGTSFVGGVLNGVTSFITVTRFDTVIWSPSIAYALDGGNFSSLVSNVDYNAMSPNGIQARPGLMSISYNSGVARSVTMPTSYVSGHTVSMRAAAAADLLADVMQWYSQSPH